MLISNSNLQRELGLSSQDALLLDVDLELHASRVFRRIGALNESLSTSTYLTDLVASAAHAGIYIDGAVKNELAHVLWDRGELQTAVQMLRGVTEDCDFSQQSIPIAKAETLATLVSIVMSAVTAANCPCRVSEYLTHVWRIQQLSAKSI